MKKSLVKSKNPDILLRFLLNLDDKICELMPQYATKVHKTLYVTNLRKWRKIKENQCFQGVFKE